MDNKTDNNKADREESRFEEMMGAIKSPSHEPDKAFLKKLKAESTQAFLAAETGRPTNERTKRMKIFKKLIPTAAAACIVAGITVAVIFLTLGDGGASITWADVQERIRNVRTMTLMATIKKEGSPSMEMKMMFKEPGLMRYESSSGSLKSVMILDARKNKRIVLLDIGTQKSAFASDNTGLSAEFRQKKGAIAQNFLTEFKKLIEESETELGEKEIDGRVVKGYRVEKGNMVSTIWVDAKTAQPVEMIVTMPRRETEMTMSDFEFDVELDDSLFSLDIPKEYTDGNMQLKKDAKIAARDTDIASLQSLVELYRVEKVAYPATLAGLVTGGYIEKIPINPVTKTAYTYNAATGTVTP